MVIQREAQLEEIKALLICLEKWIEADKHLQHQNTCIELEYFFRDLLNLTFGWNLANANALFGKNHNSFDLSDDANSIAVQVTVTSTAAKIRKTLRSFIGNHGDKYKRLVFVYPKIDLGRSAADFKGELKGYDFDVARDRLGLGDILRHAQDKSIDEQSSLLAFLQKEIGSLIPSLNKDLSRNQLSFLCNPSFDAEVIAHTRGFVGRKWLADRLTSWIEDLHGPSVACLTGKPGVGKTALCAWLSQTFAGNPIRFFCKFGHFEKGKASCCIQSIVFQLSERIPEYRKILELKDAESLLVDANAASLFDVLLLQPIAAAGLPESRDPITVILDGLDELSPTDALEIANTLASSLHSIPRWLRFLVTSRPDKRLLATLQGAYVLSLDADSSENRADLITFAQAAIRPKLSQVPQEEASQIIRALCLQSEGLFLYLQWIRIEIENGRLDPTDPNALPVGLNGALRIIVTRQIKDIALYTRKIRPILEIVVASFQPLNTLELMAFCELSRYDIEELLSVLGPLFSMKNERLLPFHTVLLEWLTDSEQAQEYYVDPQIGNSRLTEICWDDCQVVERASNYAIAYAAEHLTRSEDWERLGRLLGDLTYVTKWNPDVKIISRYWTAVQNNSHFRLIDTYSDVVSNPSKYADSVSFVAVLVRDAGSSSQALKVSETLVASVETAPNSRKKLDVIHNHAILLSDLDQKIESLRFFEMSEGIARAIGDEAYVSTCLGSRAAFCLDSGDLDLGEELIQEQEKICLQIPFLPGLVSCQRHYAHLAMKRNLLDDAGRHYELSENAAKACCDEIGVVNARLGLAHIAELKKDNSTRRQHLEYAEKTAQLRNLDRLLSQVRLEQAHDYLRDGELESAIEYYSESNALSDLPFVRVQALVGKSKALWMIQKHDEAIALLQSVLSESDLHDDLLALAHRELAIRYKEVGKTPLATKHHRKIIECYRQGKKYSKLVIALNEYAISLSIQKDSKLICDLLREATTIARATENLHLLFGSLEIYSAALAVTGRLTEAESLLDEALSLAEQHDNPRQTIEILELQLTILWDERNADKLIGVYKRLETIASGIGYRLADDNLETLNKLALYKYLRLREQGELATALELLTLAERVFRRHKSHDRLMHVIAEKCRTLGDSGLYNECINLSSEWRKLAESADDIDSVVAATRNEILARTLRGDDESLVAELRQRLFTMQDLSERSELLILDAKAEEAQRQGDFERAIGLYGEAVKIARKQNNKQMWAAAQINRIVLLYSRDQQITAEADLHELASNVARDVELRHHFKVVLTTMSHNYPVELGDVFRQAIVGDLPVKEPGKIWLPKDGGIMEMQRAAKRNQAISAITSKKIGRNSPCPCGSGKKYKRCCARR